LYPIILKKIDVSIIIQIWTRLFSYLIISALFINREFIKKYLLKRTSIIFSLINFSHVVFSYIGFKLLDSGVALSIFFTFPIMILIIETRKFNPHYLIIIFGLFLLSFNNKNKISSTKEDEPNEKNNTLNTKNNTLNTKNTITGIIIMLLGAFTEALLFYCIKKIPTQNSWNHVFIAYLPATVLFTIYFIYYYYKNILDENIKEIKYKFHHITIVLILINCIIGTIGYFLRFYAAYRLDAYFYSILSYFGIITGYIYGYYIAKQDITWNKVVGTIIIIISSIFILKIK
jgi:drug/metabolite transporter (DMT)-like permease